jgi:RsiW-degrading membrane proteinase PrsW (M82 family)
MLSDLNIFSFAFMGGLVPALFWLYIWLKEDKKNPEPKGIIFLVFILGMLMVVLVLPIQKIIQEIVTSLEGQIIGWATAEEVLKYFAVVLVLSKTNYIDEPIDWPIYLIVASLGFAALENSLFLIKPLSLNHIIDGIWVGQLRFVGSTLLHVAASAIIGIALGLSFHLKNLKRYYFYTGLIFAIVLHTVFNLFIIKSAPGEIMGVYVFLWVMVVVVLLLLEKVKRIRLD